MSIRESFKKLGRKIRGLAMANTLLKESLFSKQNIIDRQLTEIKRLKKNIDHLIAERGGSEALLRNRATKIAGLVKNANEANALMKAQRAINIKLTQELNCLKVDYKDNKRLLETREDIIARARLNERAANRKIADISELLKIKPRPDRQTGLSYKSRPKGTN